MIGKKDKQRLLSSICNYLSTRCEMLDRIENSYKRLSRVEFLKSIHYKFPKAIEISDLYSDIFSLIDQMYIYHSPLNNLQTAMLGCNNSKKKLRNLQNYMVFKLCLRNNPNSRNKQLGYIETISLTPHQQPYPPVKHCIYEKQLIHDLWTDKLQLEKQPDSRIKQIPMHQMGTVRLQLDIPEEKSMIFKNAK